MHYYGGGPCGSPCGVSTPVYTGTNNTWAIILVLFILLVIILGPRFL